MDHHDRIPQDGEVYALGTGGNHLRAEFVNTNGRLAWRLYDRLGRGVLLTESELRILVRLSTNVLNHIDREEN